MYTALFSDTLDAFEYKQNLPALVLKKNTCKYLLWLVQKTHTHTQDGKSDIWLG